jgi:hypothetical protein
MQYLCIVYFASIQQYCFYYYETLWIDTTVDTLHIGTLKISFRRIGQYSDIFVGST